MDRLDTLRLFVSIVDTGSLAAAARRHNQTPPAVTRALAALEERLGVRLVERTTRRSRATEAGQKLAEQSRRLLADYDDAMAEAGGSAAAPRGRLRIGAPLVFGKLHVAPVVAAFLDAQKLVAVDLLLADRNVDLIDDAIDVAVRIGPLEDAALVARRVGSLRRIVAASPAYLAAHGTPERPEDLAAHETIQFSAPTVTSEWRFQSPDGTPLSVRVQPRFTVNAAEAAVEAAIAGRGVVTALSYQAATAIADGRLLRLLREFERPAMPVSLVFASARLLPARVRAFLDFAVPLLGALPVLRED